MAHELDSNMVDVPHTRIFAPKRIKSAGSLLKRSRSNLRMPPRLPTASGSAEDVSSISDLGDNEHGYMTEMTTPASSEICPDEMGGEEVEDFRDREYPQLIGKTYLDHGGTTLYARSLIEDFSADMISNLYGNPHSASRPSAIAGHRVDTIREKALRFFNADPEHFDLVFVANATAAIKLVIDCFKDHAAVSNTPIWFGYHRDAHTSLVGMREATKLNRCFTSDEEVDIWINSGGLGGPRARQLGLFAYPGQSNMTGRRLPLSWPGRIRKSLHKAATYTLLDAAALASTAPLDLSNPATSPDFVALSFYKIFGFPNIGALIVRKDSAHVLESRRYFGGGTVDMVIAVHDTWHAKKDTVLHDRLEDGTLPFHSIFALDHAIDVHRKLYGQNPMKFISMHTAQLAKQMFDGVSSLRHSNGNPLVRIYKDDNAIYGDPSLQGATMAFNVVLADGSLVGFEDVEQAADQRDIFLRSGSLCNPGGMATYLQWSPAEMRAAYAAGHRCHNPTQVIFGKATGVVRASLGGMSTAQDVNVLVDFLRTTYINQTAVTLALPAEPLPLPRFGSVSGTQSPAAMSTQSLVPPKSAGSCGLVNDMSECAFNDTVKPKAPPFVPADYTKIRKPWEDEMRKTQVLMNVDPKTKEAEEANLYARNNQTPSVKARKFGRSVVNLLRTKSHITEQTNNRASTYRPTPRGVDGYTSSHKTDSTTSKHEMQKNQFLANMRAMGM